jgi:hypothetical protein
MRLDDLFYQSLNGTGILLKGTLVDQLHTAIGMSLISRVMRTLKLGARILGDLVPPRER